MEKVVEVTKENMDVVIDSIVKYAVDAWVKGWNTHVFLDPTTMEILTAVDSGNTGYSPELEELYCIPADVLNWDGFDNEFLTEEEINKGVNPLDLDDFEERFQEYLEEYFFNVTDAEYNIWEVQRIFSKIFKEGEEGLE